MALSLSDRELVSKKKLLIFSFNFDGVQNPVDPGNGSRI